MKSFDFEYDGITLRDMGFTICNFGSKGLETISIGSEIVFDTVAVYGGSQQKLVNARYEDCLTTTFQICKHPCVTNQEEISVTHMREIMSWLNRKEFHKLKFIGDDEYINLFFEASFNVSKIELDGKLYGFELKVITNRPFALQEQRIINIDNALGNSIIPIIDTSDEEGYIYPEMKITMLADGMFYISNEAENRKSMSIKNCVNGEVIEVKHPLITSSIESHDINNDFNWHFFKILNTFNNKVNRVYIPTPCLIEIKYNPIVKVGI